MVSELTVAQVRCAAGCDPTGPMWFCPRGLSQGETFYVYEEIPPDCWKKGEKPDL